MSTNPSQEQGLQPSLEEAAAVARLTILPEWQKVQAYLHRRLLLRQRDLQNADPDRRGYIGQMQGRCLEMQDLLKLPITAEKILEGRKTGS